jgi:hypothetical protein
VADTGLERNDQKLYAHTSNGTEDESHPLPEKETICWETRMTHMPCWMN